MSQSLLADLLLENTLLDLDGILSHLANNLRARIISFCSRGKGREQKERGRTSSILPEILSPTEGLLTLLLEWASGRWEAVEEWAPVDPGRWEPVEEWVPVEPGMCEAAEEWPWVLLPARCVPVECVFDPGRYDPVVECECESWPAKKGQLRRRRGGARSTYRGRCCCGPCGSWERRCLHYQRWSGVQEELGARGLASVEGAGEGGSEPAAALSTMLGPELCVFEWVLEPSPEWLLDPSPECVLEPSPECVLEPRAECVLECEPTPECVLSNPVPTGFPAWLW